MRRRVAAAGIAVIALAFALAIPEEGSAATTIGAVLTGSAGNLNCAGVVTCTASNTSLPPGFQAPGGLVAPADGVVVRWRVLASTTVTPLTLRVLRPGNSATRTGAGTGQPETPVASTTSTFAARLPIKAGDGIGVDGGLIPIVPSTAAASSHFWHSPPLADGGPPRAGLAGPASFQFAINADIEADSDHDGYGDETQDGCPASAVAPGADCRLTVQVGEGGRMTGLGISCPGDCTETYPQGTQVALVARPARGFGSKQSTVTGGTCTGAELGDCTFYMTGDKTVTASFFDRRNPHTTITKAPKRKSSKRKVKIKFKSDEPGSTFACALDKKIKGRGHACTSPFKAKVKPGKHTFMVRATDPSGLPDPTPATVKFTITSRR
jgi:hypothetical protein